MSTTPVDHIGIEDDIKDASYFTFANIRTAFLILAIFTFLFKDSSLKYYLKYSVFIFMVVFTCIVGTPFALLRPKNPANLIFVYPFAQFTAFLLNIKFELRGREILAKDEAGVLAANHQSALDILAHCCIMDVVMKCVIVSRIQLFRILPYGIFMKLCGSIFVDRQKGRASNETLIGVAPFLAEHKSKLLIYPEGKRHLNIEVLNPFKKGAFRLAITGQIPIIPIVISPFYFINSKEKTFKSGHVILKALDPISTVGLTLDDVDSLTEKTWTIMNEEYQLLREEIGSYKS